MLTIDSDKNILVVDDEKINWHIIAEMLDGIKYYHLHFAEDGEQALEMLSSVQPGFDLVLLDKIMPGMGGIAVLKKIRENPEWQHIPIIMQTASNSTESVAEGIRAGVFYYLTKPYSAEILQPLVSAALLDREHTIDLQKQLNICSRSINFMQTGCFVIKTLAEARDLAKLLAQTAPDPKKIVIGLAELLVNAVEHGNLDIDYAEKSRLLKNNTWLDEVKRRQTLPEYQERTVKIHVNRDSSTLSFMIEDEGKGFEWQKYLTFDPERVFDPNGRGIAMAHSVSFDTLEFLDKGNCVLASIGL